MTDEAKAQFLELSAQHLDLLKGFYHDVQWKYFGRIVADYFVLPQSILDSISGVPQAVRDSLKQAGIAMQTLVEMAPLVPSGGPPHGAPENWVAAWVDLAENTEGMLHMAEQTIGRTAAFTAMMESWRKFSAIIGKVIGSIPKLASDISMAVIVIGGLLIIRELKRGK